MERETMSRVPSLELPEIMTIFKTKRMKGKQGIDGNEYTGEGKSS